MSRSPSGTSLLLTLVVIATAAHAQTERSGGEAQRIMQQYQQLAAERTTLKTQLADMKKQLDDAQAQLATAKKERDALKSGSAAQLAALATARDTAEKSLEQNKQRTTELVARFRETATTLKDAEADRGRLQSELTARNAAFDQCAAANLSLYEISGDVLNRYEHIGFSTMIGASNPFFRVTRARIENLVDEYRARAVELRVKKPGA